MAPGTMRIRGVTLGAGLLLVVAVELLLRRAAPHIPLPPLAVLGLGRLLQTAGLLWAVLRLEGGLASIGASPHQWLRGVWTGAAWSLGFAAFAGLGMLLIQLTGTDALALLRFPLAGSAAETALLFLVGGLIAPLAEEIFFRGLLYSFFRRWGVAAALIVSTAVFVALHATQGLPVTQIVGGLVFAAAYETSRNLMVPVIIHVTGNLALFTLALTG
jgi:uncharacterized protein